METVVQKPPGSAHLSFTMAGVLTAGGIAGYLKAKSTPSLAAGLIFGGAFAYSGKLISDGDCLKGHRVGLACSSLLTGAMLARFARSKGRAIVPAGIAVLGATSAAYHGVKFLEWAEAEAEE